METIILESPWTFLTTERTIDFEAGTHSVDAEVHAAALAAGVSKESGNGSRHSGKGAKGDPDGPEG